MKILRCADKFPVLHEEPELRPFRYVFPGPYEHADVEFVLKRAGKKSRHAGVVPQDMRHELSAVEDRAVLIPSGLLEAASSETKMSSIFEKRRFGIYADAKLV
ncbi:hypothetical protein D3C86_1650590 [compost metagenome]